MCQKHMIFGLIRISNEYDVSRTFNQTRYLFVPHSKNRNGVNMSAAETEIVNYQTPALCVSPRPILTGIQCFDLYPPISQNNLMKSLVCLVFQCRICAITNVI